MSDFATIYEQEYQRVFAYLLGKSENWHVAEDITSQVFLVAWESWESWEDRGIPYGHYLRRIAYWHHGMYWKKEKRWQRRLGPYPYLSQFENQQLADGGPDALLDHCETAMQYALLRAALPRLRARPLRALILRYGHGLQEKDAAREMGISYEAFHSLRKGAEERLRQLILGKEPRWTVKNARARAAERPAS